MKPNTLLFAQVAYAIVADTTSGHEYPKDVVNHNIGIIRRSGVNRLFLSRHFPEITKQSQENEDSFNELLRSDSGLQSKYKQSFVDSFGVHALEGYIHTKEQLKKALRLAMNKYMQVSYAYNEHSRTTESLSRIGKEFLDNSSNQDKLKIIAKKFNIPPKTIMDYCINNLDKDVNHILTVFSNPVDMQKSLYYTDSFTISPEKQISFMGYSIPPLIVPIVVYDKDQNCFGASLGVNIGIDNPASNDYEALKKFNYIKVDYIPNTPIEEHIKDDFNYVLVIKTKREDHYHQAQIVYHNGERKIISKNGLRNEAEFFSVNDILEFFRLYDGFVESLFEAPSREFLKKKYEALSSGKKDEL